MLRRFHFTIKFMALEEQGIKTLLNKYLPAYGFTASHFSKLASYNSVTPGDFARLNGRIRFMDSDEVSPDLICTELCKIQKEKNGDIAESEHHIGFSAYDL